MSPGLLGDTEAYFGALTAFREGDVGSIVRRSCEASLRALGNGEQLMQDLTAIRSSWDDRLTARRDSVAWRLVDDLVRQPAVTVKTVQEELGVSQPAVQRAIDALVRAGILTTTSANRRNRFWVCDEVAVAMDAFAERARRRVG